jgi:peptidoglycan/LPS O-acetylase OafA/YrhL
VSSARAKLIPHLPALDGLRGLALLGVLFFHSKKLLVGGYLGVDLFFVLSGYLITSLLLAESRESGRIALADFWVRRARRLFPALLSLMPAIAVYAWLLAKPEELERIRTDAVATLAYVANWSSVASERSYWEMFAAPSPLEHTWSLAIEEQFYLLWPLVVVLALRRGSARTVLALALGGAALSMAAMFFLYAPARTSRVYFGTDTRATAIFAGIAFAVLVPPTTTFSKRATRILDGFGLVAIIGLSVAWWSLPGESPLLYRGGFWLTEIAALVLVATAIAGPEQSIVARVLAFRPFVLVGLVSYGLYLWHWPIDVVITPERLHVGTNAARIVQFVTTFAIAMASYFGLEKPIRTRGVPFGRPVLVTSLAVLASLCAVGVATRTRLLRTVEPTAIAPAPATATDPRLAIVLFGDSTANSLGWTLRGTRKPGLVVELQGKDGCAMVDDGCRGEQWKSDIERIHPDVALVFGGGAYLHPFVTANGSWVKACHPAWQAHYEGVLRHRLAELASHDVRTFLLTLPHSRRPWDGAEENREIDCINRVSRAVASEVAGVEVLDLAERVCPNGDCPEREPEEAHAIRPDGIHFDMEGAQPVARWILQRIIGPTAANP